MIPIAIGSVERNRCLRVMELSCGGDLLFNGGWLKKRKLGLVKRIQKQITKFALEKENFNFVTD